MTLYLIHPITQAVAAELISDKEIVIHDEQILKSVTINGIVVSESFKKEYKLNGKVYPTDDKEIFAKAFAQFKFIHGLQQQGYQWRKFREPTYTDIELAKHVIAIHNKIKATSSTTPSE